MMKTLMDLKRDLSVGTKVKLISRFGEVPKDNGEREVVKKQGNGLSFKVLDTGKNSFLDYPKASLLEHDGETIKTYSAGYRELNAEEQAIVDNEPKDEEQSKIDMLTDGSQMFYRKKHYYADKGFEYLFNSSKMIRGKRLAYEDGKKVIQDNTIKGKIELEYVIL